MVPPPHLPPRRSASQANTNFEPMTLLLHSTAFFLLATAGENGATKTAQPTAVAISSEDVDPRLATLDEVKAAGALRSSFRKHQPRPSSTKTPQPAIAEFRKSVEPILKKTCLQCHGSENQEGDFRIDSLDPNLVRGEDVNWWVEVLDVLSNSEMPPPDQIEMADEDRSRIVEWLTSEIQLASAVRRVEQGHTSFRRMARYEYNYALQDLLGLPFDFAKDLPPETASEDGFKNSSEVLQMSAMQFEYYRKLGYEALKKATVQGDKPAEAYWAISMDEATAQRRIKAEAELQKRLDRLKDNPEKQQREIERQEVLNKSARGGTHFKDLASGDIFKSSWRYSGARYAWPTSDARPVTPPVSQHVVIIPPQRSQIIELGNSIPDTGNLRIRIRAACVSTDEDRVPALRLKFGWQASNNSSASEPVDVDEILITASPEDPQYYQWDVPLSEINVRNPMRLTGTMGKTPSPSEYFSIQNTAMSGADIQIDYIEITAPVYDQWPPESHTRIFGDSYETSDSQAELDHASAVLTNFASRAWRRPATRAEVDQKLKLFRQIRPQTDSFQDAMLEVLATVLASPKFLYLVQSDEEDHVDSKDTPPKLSNSELATRLSMFLWCSTPDPELLQLAQGGQLQNESVLTKQVERMLADPRANRFSTHFVRQWLGMQLLDFLSVDRKVYPRFDPQLKEAMQGEPIAMFNDILQHNESVLDFIHTDYAMVNERLARHYELDHVYGNQFQKVKLPDGDIRGGLLTQAGLLAMNSDGKDSHPLKRGIWMLESLLNDPPAPPPPAVPEIDLADPEIAKLTLKERIENHRNNAACLSCHAKIDPWGIAFENFDAVGSWRTNINGKPVDASSLLFNKQPLNGMDGLKRFLLANRQDQFVRAVVYKMATFALGRPLSFSDQADIDEITVNVRNKQDRLKDLVTLIVTSDLFQSK